MIIYVEPWNFGYISTPGYYSDQIKKIILNYLNLNYEVDVTSELKGIHGFSKQKIFHCAYRKFNIVKTVNFDVTKQFSLHNPMKTFAVVEDPVRKIVYSFFNNDVKRHLPVVLRNAKTLKEYIEILLKMNSLPIYFKSIFPLLAGHTPDYILFEKNLVEQWKELFLAHNMSAPELTLLNFKEQKDLDPKLEQKIKNFYKKDYSLEVPLQD